MVCPVTAKSTSGAVSPKEVTIAVRKMSAPLALRISVIPPSAFLGSAAVGMLAAGADIFGCLSSGTGILLTVGIVYRFYEDLKNMQAQEQNPILAKFLK